MAKWIWQNTNAQPDEHAEFFTAFNYAANNGSATLRISADSDYALFINGTLVYNGQYPDFPFYKVYDDIDVTKYLVEGENTLAVEVWYYGISNATYFKGDAGLWFSLSAGGSVLAESGEGTLARISRTYPSYAKKLLTPQIGHSYTYLANKEDGWRLALAEGFAPAVCFDREEPAIKRPIERLVTEAPVQGVEIKREKGRILFDFGKELVGSFRLSFTSKGSQMVKICWGEHIVDGWTRYLVGPRDFSIDYLSKDGENDYTGYLRRLGLRYMELHFEEEPTDLSVWILPRNYPVTVLPFNCGNEELQKIYDVSVYTLRMCMHEHYEDCPWREQALYAMDSRNQILCGYYAFKEYDFPRACLKLMSEDRREDGMPPICYPAGMDLTIPSFGLHYFTEIREYVDHSGDWAFVSEIMPKLKSIMATYAAHAGADGLLPTFKGANYWNFYEWAEGLEGTLFIDEKQKTDLILNCLYSIALSHMAYLCDGLNITNDYAATACAINEIIDKAFYNTEANAYSMYASEQSFSELGNALAVLCGASRGERALKVCEQLAGDNNWTKITLSMKCFKYDALLLLDKAKYRAYVLEDIRKTYNKMLAAGATTFWETEKGEADFDNAGSLCHGWSAMPVYYYHTLLND